MEELTPKEELIFNIIKKSIEETGISPSVRDIRAEVGMSVSTIHSYIERLEQKGFINRKHGKSRTVRLGSDVPSEFMTRRIPVIGKVRAGFPILAYENYEDYIDFPIDIRYKNDDFFALRVQGESMIDVGIYNGDIVIVRREPVANNGDIVIALVGDEATVKTFYREEDHFRLQPENKNMAPIIVNEVSILGHVVASFRYYK